ncbi:MAG: QacE family quaternary ammonium compound efflux SMR transporter [Proteobacteria bacterium]|nr:QacE family quaternary ammonium compound efflux SMR transporter [Pseudomonadota bacterium]
MKTYLLLFVAIVAEVVATSALKASENFTRPLPSLLVVVGYSTAFFLLSITLKTLPIGVAYAIWSGVGTALVAVVGWLYYRQSLDLPAILGLTLIIAGTLVLNLFSKVAAH